MVAALDPSASLPDGTDPPIRAASLDAEDQDLVRAARDEIAIITLIGSGTRPNVGEPGSFKLPARAGGDGCLRVATPASAIIPAPRVCHAIMIIVKDAGARVRGNYVSSVT